MKILMIGASGMVGNLLLKQCLADPQVKTVVAINRRPLEVQDPKYVELIHSDFENYTDIEEHFRDVDVAHFCLGVYTGAVADDQFKKITVDYTAVFADTLKGMSPDAHFCFLSGGGADQTEKSRVSFARYKGMAENHLQNLNFSSLTIFRPGYIYPVEKRTEPNITYKLTRSFYPLIKLFGKNASIKFTELASAMFHAGLNKQPSGILENRDIIDLLA